LPQLRKLRARFEKFPGEREDVLSEVRSIQDLTAIPSLERILIPSKDELALAVVESLSENPHQKATESLVRVAVFAGNDLVRHAAAKALSYRPRHTYLPLLLAGLQMPVHGQYLTLGALGNRHLSRMILYQEGPASTRVEITDRDLTLISPTPNRGGYRMDKSIERGLAQKVAQTNARNSAQNERLFAALATATGETVESQPTAWWNWWYVNNEYHMPDYKPEEVTIEEYRGVVPVSCFVRGTPVWTTTGPMPIEKIKPGETVLARNCETGELTYKPVLQTTYRPPSPVLRIRVGSTEIRATRGHPFWVCGTGWQMAKELKAGQFLHTVAGPQKIDTVESTDDEDCFNLIVADFHNYFISDAKVLVHDNTLRGPLVARVPGLVE
jgi:hypothetical protein